MGYYIGLAFDPDEVKTLEEVVDRLLRAGCEADDDLVQDAGGLSRLLDNVRPRESSLELYHRDFAFPIEVAGSCSEAFPGHWTSSRMSWGMRPREIRKYVAPLFDIAHKAGARVWDGQFYDDIEELVAAQSRTAAKMRGLIGEVVPADGDEFEAEEEDDEPGEMSPEEIQAFLEQFAGELPPLLDPDGERS